MKEINNQWRKENEFARKRSEKNGKERKEEKEKRYLRIIRMT